MTVQIHRFASTDQFIPGRNERRKRVLFVINSLTGGGAERVMTTLLMNSKDRLQRYEIALAVLDDVPSAFEMPDWLKIFQLDCKGGIVSSIRSLDQVAREYQPDVTLSFLTRANFASCLAMMKRRLPRIISERTSTPAHLGGALRQAVTKLLMRALYPRSTRVIAVSSGVADKIGAFGVQSNAIEVIPNPVDLQALERASAEPEDLGIEGPYIVAVGRLVSVKNFALLIRAFASADLPCRLVIAGDGPERDALQALVAKARRRRSRDDAGMASEPLSAGQQGKPVCAQLRHRGLSECARGGARSGCSGGGYELQGRPGGDSRRPRRRRCARDFRSRKPDILTPVGDADCYAKALKLAMQGPVLKRMGEAGRERAKDYSAARIVSLYWDVIENELEQTPVRRAI